MVAIAEDADAPSLRVERDERGARAVVLHGRWNLRELGPRLPHLRTGVTSEARAGERRWDLRAVQSLDSAGAVMLWHAWGGRRPHDLTLRPEHEALFERLEGLPPLPPPRRHAGLSALVASAARPPRALVMHGLGLSGLLGELLLALGQVARQPARMPWLEISAGVRQAGVRALGITALVGLLIGVVISYLSAMQLKAYGAEAFIANVVGLAIIRELGPMLAAILVAGRSGSAITAQIGVMRLTQELDALSAMGISPVVRLVLPKVLALALAMPLLVLWTDSIAMIGGMLAAGMELQIGFEQFLFSLPSVVPVFNLWFGLVKGMVFGIVIALVACHFGLRIRPNTESLGTETTNSVVTSITLVVLIDAVFAIAFNNVGWW